MKVVEIFKSIEGEGKRVGAVTTFVRLWGCNLRCKYCDTKYSYEEIEEIKGDAYKVMTIESIVQDCLNFGTRNVTVTGGEPLMHPGVDKLLYALIEQGFYINVETNGSIVPRILGFDKFASTNTGRVFYTMDYKGPSSGVERFMNMEAIDSLSPADVLKFVVGCQEDLDKVVEVLDKMTSKPSIYISPIFCDIEPKEIVDFVLKKQLNNCFVQVQLHKVIWHPDERGV